MSYGRTPQIDIIEEQWKAFQQAQKNGKDTSVFMPTGSWKDLLEQPVQRKLK